MPETRHAGHPPGGGLSGAASATVDEVLARTRSSPDGLTDQEAAARLAAEGPNAVRGHRARAGLVLWRQLRSPILILLLITAAISALVGERLEAGIIGVILAISIVLGFSNEYRAERAADALHDRLRHTAIVVRSGHRRRVDVTELVTGDVVVLSVGTVVPGDLRLLTASELECDESIVTGEAGAAAKSTEPVAAGAPVGDLASCVLMGTVVHAGSGSGVVVATAAGTEFGRIAAGLSDQEPQTEFQRGLRQFSFFLLIVALLLTSLIFVAALLLGRPPLESLLFSLAIAVGITPQLLPAVVSTSLAAGSRTLARMHVLVKRMVCIEDLGDLDLLVTDKTGTLTTGQVSFERAVPVGGSPVEHVTDLGMQAADLDPAAADRTGENPLDAALRAAAPDLRAAPSTGIRRIDVRPFDHERRRTTVLVAAADGGPLLVVKGAPESVLPLCGRKDPDAAATLDELYRTGARVVAVASAPAPGAATLTDALEHDLVLAGFLAFSDAVKNGAAASLRRLAELGVEVKVATGDSAVVAQRVCAQLGMPGSATLTGDAVDALGDAELADAARDASIFARVSPEQKARIVRALRGKGRAVGFLGDGVNDALALHRADVGISVDSAVDVAKDAADVLLLEKDLGVLAAGVTEGRRIFANTIKYVLMGTSSNFGNMFSASVASIVLPFLPMLPGQILLNNLLYDSSQLAIPTDHVDPEQLRTPAQWDIGAIRRFMLLFGPISSLFDFATFALMLGVLHAAAPEFQSGWFIESIATQTLIVFAIRTRRVPFLRSRASLPLTLAVLGAVAIGTWLPYAPVAGPLGFSPLPAPFFLALVAMVVAYLVLVEAAKAWYFARLVAAPAAPVRLRGYRHRVARRASRFTTRSPRGAPALPR